MIRYPLAAIVLFSSLPCRAASIQLRAAPASGYSPAAALTQIGAPGALGLDLPTALGALSAPSGLDAAAPALSAAIEPRPVAAEPAEQPSAALAADDRAAMTPAALKPQAAREEGRAAQAPVLEGTRSAAAEMAKDGGRNGASASARAFDNALANGGAALAVSLPAGLAQGSGLLAAEASDGAAAAPGAEQPAAPYPLAPLAKPFEFRWGMTSADLPGRTILEKHLAFFDTVGDGKLTVARTFTRLRQMGFSLLEATKTAVAIQFGIRGLLGKNAPGGILAALNLQVDVKDSHLIGRGGTSKIFDRAGNFAESQWIRLAWASRMGAYRDRRGRDAAGSFFTPSDFAKFQASNLERDNPGKLQSIGNRTETDIIFAHFNDGTVVENGKTVPVVLLDTFRKLFDGTLFYEKVLDTEIERAAK
jgi:hypothetical protein